MGVVVFNGKSSKDYGIEVEHPPRYQFAKRNYTLTKIPGKSGSVVDDDESYLDVDREYELAIAVREGETFADAGSRLAQWLSTSGGWKRLQDSYEPLVYREALFNEAGDIENILNGAGRIKVKFTCKPFRWLLSGEEPIVVPSGETLSIQNPTIYTAKPMLLLDCNGQGTVTINGVIVEVTGYIGQMVVNCETQNSYYEDQNLNEFTNIPVFPVLNSGPNEVSWSGSFNSVQIIPRWWTK
jgi:phage-related protein